MYNGLWRTLNKSEMVINTSCIKALPAVPCSALAAMSIDMDVLSAAKMLATAKTATAPRSAGLRPQMSLHFAHIGPDAAFAKR